MLDLLKNDFALTELDRRLANLIRVGTVDQTDYANARVRIRTGELLTGWLPWLTRRAGHDQDWWAPEVGEQVMVLSPSGDPAQGVVLGALYQARYAAPGNEPTVHRTRYADGTTIEYDRAAHRLRVQCAGDVEIVAAGNLTLRGKRIDLNP
jgi:phage baseplate assembly protein V